MSTIAAKTGWTWLKQGMGLFRKQPAALTTLLLANVLFSFAIGIVPVLGQIAAVLLIPSFSMAFMQACRMIDQDQRISPAVLLTGFRKPAVIALCKIGLAYLAVTALLTLIGYLMLSDAFWHQAANPTVAAVIDPSDVLGVLLIAVLEIGTLMALCFASPLAFWQQMPPGKAIFYSFFAVMRSARVFLVMLMAWFGIFMATTVVMLMVFGQDTSGRVAITWLGFLFILLLQCAMYAAYRQIFGVPAPDAKPAAVG
ncbi:MAG: BPSS1780 family membrane protein [Pseudomonadota bacterium]|nr:BPSS1780 family membrane protein [Pseudomonadota bacterium]